MFETDPNTGKPYTFHLSDAADCASPDTPYGRTTPPSPGAVFLHNVYGAATEAASYADGADPSDTAHEVADSAVPIYTHEMWATFTDLAAYRENLDELGYVYDAGNPEAMPSAALYLIGQRLAYAVLTADADADATEEG